MTSDIKISDSAFMAKRAPNTIHPSVALSKSDPKYLQDLVRRLRELAGILPICDEAADMISDLMGAGANA